MDYQTRRDWVMGLQAGDAVTYGPGYPSDGEMIAGRVERLTKTQIILENGLRFRRNAGSEVAPVSRYFLFPPAPSAPVAEEQPAPADDGFVDTPSPVIDDAWEDEGRMTLTTSTPESAEPVKALILDFLKVECGENPDNLTSGLGTCATLTSKQAASLAQHDVWKQGREQAHGYFVHKGMVVEWNCWWTGKGTAALSADIERLGRDCRPSPCSCGALAEGYTEASPAHDCSCRMYSREMADQAARERSRVRYAGERGIAGFHNAMLEREYEDWQHNPY